MSIEYIEYKLSYQDILSSEYELVVNNIYSAIPAHDMELERSEINALLGYYARLYATLSFQFSMVLAEYNSRDKNHIYKLKNALEQSLKVVRFQYDSLSRKITVDKDEFDGNR